jgi:hypothetical protein
VVRTQKGLEEFYRTDYNSGLTPAWRWDRSGRAQKGITADVVAHAKRKGPLSGCGGWLLHCGVG